MSEINIRTHIANPDLATRSKDYKKGFFVRADKVLAS